MAVGKQSTPLILDGGLGTLLLSRGAFAKGDPLWSVRCLASPAESEGRLQLRQAHLDYLSAGANIIKTNSYQMSVEHLVKCIPGLTQEEALEMMKDSVRIARDACQEFWQTIGGEKSGQKQLMVAGSIGPYGACQADMSEYTGTYADSMSEDDFIKWHRPRLLALLQAGVDYLAFETFPALKEAVAVLKLVRQEAPNVPAWISFSCKDEQHTCHGEDLFTAFQEIWKIKTNGLQAIGINCTPAPLIEPILRSLNSCNIPVVLYPNREEHVTESDDLNLGKLASKWLDIYSNVFAIGGCCFYHPGDVNVLRHALESSSELDS